MGVAVAMAAIPADGAFMAAMVGMAGSTLGYAAAVAVYEELSTALHDYELAKEERIRVERECAEAVGALSANIGVICLGMSRIIWRLMMNCLIEHSMQWIKR